MNSGEVAVLFVIAASLAAGYAVSRLVELVHVRASREGASGAWMIAVAFFAMLTFIGPFLAAAIR
jgi:hypothetical protein